MCGGSLIAPNVVLSAAHCLDEGYNNITHLYINRHDITAPLQDGEEEINVAETVPHPYYDSTTRENDVMILKLELNSTLQPVAYDIGNADTSEGENVTVMGFGDTTDGGNSSDVLLEVEVDIVSNEKCSDQYGGSLGILDFLGCSGGPLIIKGDDAGEDIQVGVVSWGGDCADPEKSGVYARVSEFTNWTECLVDGGTEKYCKSLAIAPEQDLSRKMCNLHSSFQQTVFCLWDTISFWSD